MHVKVLPLALARRIAQVLSILPWILDPALYERVLHLDLRRVTFVIIFLLDGVVHQVLVLFDKVVLSIDSELLAAPGGLVLVHDLNEVTPHLAVGPTR